MADSKKLSVSLRGNYLCEIEKSKRRNYSFGNKSTGKLRVNINILAGLILFLVFNSANMFAQNVAAPIGGGSTCAITPAAQVCPKSVTTYSAPSGMTNYSWSITGAGTISGPVNRRTVNVTAGTTCSTIYKLTVSYLNGLTNTSCSQSIPIVDNIVPTISASANKTVPSNTQNIIFDNPVISDNCGMPNLVVVSTTSTPQLDGSVNYVRTWKAVDACGNESPSVSQTVTVSATIACSITGNGSICPGGTTSLCAPAGMTTYLWNTGATTQCINVTTAGTYTATVTDQSGVSTCSKTVTVNTPPACSITGNATICSGNSTNLCAPAGATTYLWNNGATTQCVTASAPGSYSVKVTDANGCSSTCSKEVTSGTVTNCSVTGNNSICSGGTANLCATAGAASYSWSTGETTQCINVTTAGTYTATVTNSSGCTSTCSKTINLNSSPNCTIAGNLLICPGGNTQLCASQGQTAYSWSTGETAQCITVSTVGNYSVTVTGANGCTSTCSQTVDLVLPPTCSISGNTTICPGGTTNLCAPAGMASYVWSTGATTQCISVSEGTYTVTITNSNGCSSTCNKTVTVVNPPTCSINGKSTICPGTTVNLCAPATMTSYNWSTGATSQCITISSAGTYTVTITNAAGCISTCSKTVTASTPQTCSITGNNSFCPGGSSNLCAPAGAVSYLWSTGSTTQCIAVTTGGNYSVTITDEGGCSSVCSKSVTVNNPAPCSITGNNSFCAGGSTNLCAPAGMTSYLWSTGASTQCITASSQGNYSVTTVDANGCSASCNKDVTVKNATQCSITGNTSICAGGSVNLCAPVGAINYSWSTGATTQCISVSSAGTYSATVTDESGCSSTCNKTIIVNNPPSCLITGSASFCRGGSTNLCAPAGATSYLWSNGATSQCITVNSAANYSVTITSANGCSSTCNKNVTVDNPPNCSITGSQLICTGGTANLCASVAGATYAWSTGATTQCITVNNSGNFSVTVTGANGCSSTCSQNLDFLPSPNCNISGNTSICTGSTTDLCSAPNAASYSWSTGATTQCINVSSPGTYTVTATAANGCSSTCNKNVIVNNPPSCLITGGSSFCRGGSTDLCAPAGAVSYLWSNGATTQCITVNSAANYSVTITGINGCSSSCSKNVTVDNPPNCSITGNLLICTGGSTNLCASVAGASYAWSTGATTQCITVSNSGNYSVTVTGANGCSSTCSQNLDFLTTPNCAITGNTTICSGATTDLCSAPGAASYSWSNGATTRCINVSTSGTYTVLATAANGCTSSCTKTVTVNVPISCSITGNGSLCAGGSTNLCSPEGASFYEWSTGATTSCITVNSSGNYTVILTDQNGCISTCSKAVTVYQKPSCSITGNTDICQNNNSVFTASGGTTYLWSNGATTQSITINTPGQYSVNVSNENGCSSSCSRNLAVHSCGISLTKTPDICDFPEGVSTNVNFKYVVKNTGDYFSASGNVMDDNGTAANVADDLKICDWGPLSPGDSAICYHSFTISTTHTNKATASGTTAGLSVSANSTATVTGVNCTCNLSYPDNSNLPRSAVLFNESEVLRASDPGTSICGSTGSVIKLWYNDEHALLLGVRSVIVKSASGTTTTNYSITPTPATAGCFSNPLVGDTISSGDQAANDMADGGGRPLWPSIFVTDLTVNGSSSRKGDWQQGGRGIPPTRVCGTWKSAVKTIDKTKYPAVVTIATDVDPAKVNWALGSGADTPPGGFATLKDEGYGAEVCWDVNSLGLIPGHTYRLVFMVHDGDQNKTGGDVGETCTTIHIPDGHCSSFTPPPPPPPPPPTDKVCYTGTSHSFVKASQEWTINTTTNQATIRTTFSKNFVDNTYGSNAIGWPSGHTFSQLVGSDHLQMALYDGNNVKKMEFNIDYVTASNTVPSGYKCLGVSGGEGSMVLGSASDVVSATTSIDKNLNTFGYALVTNSPATNSSYTPNASYPNWIYDVWYEVTVKLSAFGSAGFGRPVITFVHASPSKTGSNSETVVDTVCTQSSPRIAALAPDSPTRINAIAYPNPFGDDITINFITPLDEDATITITDVAGRIVESARHAAGTLNMGHNLKAGIYFVRISQGDFYRILKIIKSDNN